MSKPLQLILMLGGVLLLFSIVGDPRQTDSRPFFGPTPKPVWGRIDPSPTPTRNRVYIMVRENGQGPFIYRTSTPGCDAKLVVSQLRLTENDIERANSLGEDTVYVQLLPEANAPLDRFERLRQRGFRVDYDEDQNSLLLTYQKPCDKPRLR